MNKNYRKALINEMFDQNILNSEDDRAEIKDIIEEIENDPEDGFSGEFEDDLEYLINRWNEHHEVEEEEAVETPEKDIEEIVASLHIGFNLVPGIGVGYCSNEADLEQMKNFVRGGLSVAQGMFGLGI